MSVFAMRLVNLRSITCYTDQNFKENAHFGALNRFTITKLVSHFETSLVMAVAVVTKNDVISHLIKPFLGKNTCFFPLLTTIKVDLVAKMIQSGYLSVIFHVKHNHKITISCGLNLISYSW